MIAELIHKIAQMAIEEDIPYYPRPSMSGPERCIRSMVYHRLNFPKEPLPGRAIVIFNDSNWHEQLTNDWIRKTAFKIHSEQMKVNCFFVRDKKVKGSIDGIVTDLLNTDRLLETKAINHFTFQKYLKGELPLDYITQTCCYIAGVKKDNPDIDEGILLIKNKNTSAYLEFLILYDSKQDICTVKTMTASNGEIQELNHEIPDILDDAIAKFAGVEDYASNKMMPVRQYEIDSWRCEYCAWGKLCWQGYEKEFQALTTNNVLEGEIIALSKYYLETSMHLKEMTKEKDELNAKIKTILKEKQTREGRAGEYLIKIRLQQRQSIDKELIPKVILDKATKISNSEILNIRKIKEG